MPIFEILLVCIGVGSLTMNMINFIANHIKEKGIILKKYSITIHMDKAIEDFINIMTYLDNSNITATEIIHVRNNSKNIKLIVPTKTTTINCIDFIPLKMTPSSSISGIIITCDDQQRLTNFISTIIEKD